MCYNYTKGELNMIIDNIIVDVETDYDSMYFDELNISQHENNVRVCRMKVRLNGEELVFGDTLNATAVMVLPNGEVEFVVPGFDGDSLHFVWVSSLTKYKGKGYFQLDISEKLKSFATRKIYFTVHDSLYGGEDV